MGRGGKKYENEYPAQYSYQFFAYYQKDVKGYYMACEDGNAYTKTIGLHYSPDVDGMDMVFTNYPEGMGEVCYYTLPYSYTFTFFEGDWQTAAKIYRNWVIQQKWYTPLRDRNISKAVKEKGGLAVKFISPGFNGMPDRIVLMPCGRIAFVEVKAPGEKPRPLQLSRHRLLRRLGFKVYVLDHPDQIGGIIDEIQATNKSIRKRLIT